jgi:hypothetical protein
VSADWLGFEPWWYDLGRRGFPVTTVDVHVLGANSTAPGIEVVNWKAQSFDTCWGQAASIADVRERQGTPR